MKHMSPEDAPATIQALRVTLGPHVFGIDIRSIEDVIHRQPRTAVPLAAPYVLGVLNLRGQVVTEIDMAQVLEVERGTDAQDETGEHALIVLHHGDRYSLVFDHVSEVLTLDSGRMEPLPETLDDNWSGLARGIYRAEKELMVLLDPHAALDSLIHSHTAQPHREQA